MCFRVALAHTTAFIFALYRPHNSGVTIFKSISEQIDHILSAHPSANIHICGDFNVHNVEWLAHSNKTDDEGRFCHDFSIAYDLTQIVNEPTRVPDSDSQYASLLDLFLTTCPELCSSSVLSPLGSSDHSVVSVKIKTKCYKSSDVPLHRTVYRYTMADWDSFRTFIADLPLSSMFKKDVSSIVSDLTEWLIVGIDHFIPAKKFQQKPNSQPWFSPECAAAIAHRNHFFHSFQRNRCTETKAAFRTASNHCKRVIKNARELYAKSIKSKVAEQRLGSHQFWQIANRILNRSVCSIPTIINGPEVISSAADKAKLFAKNFAANSTLCDQGHQPPVFPTVSDNTLCDIQISVRDVAKLIKNLDSSKANWP